MMARCHGDPVQCTIITLFPHLFTPFRELGIVGRACSRGLLSIETVNPREYAPLPHRNVDDTPYGGGPGMVLRPEPLDAALTRIKERQPDARIIYPSPCGPLFRQSTAVRLSQLSSLVFLCGRYEGIDQRIIDLHVDEEISLGDFILVGGEIAAMAMIEASARLLPGALGNATSSEQESIGADDTITLEAPVYTKPAVFRGLAVPEPLLSGNHQRIASWRAEQSRKRTARVRPSFAHEKSTAILEPKENAPEGEASQPPKQPNE
jgi:tRNA (guanine37-N1)-methyltransferase